MNPYGQQNSYPAPQRDQRDQRDYRDQPSQNYGPQNYGPPNYGPPQYGQGQQQYGPPQPHNYMKETYGQRPLGVQRNNNQYDDMMKDFNSQTNENIQNNLSKGAAISELEMILDGERRRAKDIKSQMEQDLEGEKRMRVDFENKLLRLKEEAQKREMFVTELEYKLSTVSQENDAVVHENRAIKDEINRMQEIYGHKIRELEDKSSYMKKQQIQLEDRFRVDFDRMKSDYEQKMEGISREWEYRLKASEEKSKTLTSLKADMEQEIRYLQDNIMKCRLEAEEELREAVVRVQDEEMKKYMSNMRSLEQKFKACDEARENLGRRNIELGKEISDRDKHINQMQMDFDQQTNRFKQELSEYHNQLNQTNISRDKIRNELQGRDASLQRMEADLMGMQKQLQKEREARKQEIDHILEENNKEKRSLEDIRDQQARKINDQDKVIKQMEVEIERLRGEYERLCQSLQNNVHRSINQTMSENSAPRFDNRRPQFGHKYE